MSKLTYEETVRADVVLDMQEQILRTVIDAIRTHGDESPDNALAMIAASFIMAIESINDSFQTDRLSVMISELIEMKQKNKLQ
jgi:hypothetical protein